MARGANEVLYTSGYRNMVILDEGIPAWHEKGYPTVATAVRRP